MATISITFSDVTQDDGTVAMNIATTTSTTSDDLGAPSESPALVLGTYLLTLTQDQRIADLAMEASKDPAFRDIVLKAFKRE